ncbi:hypothetical protein MRS44_003894 [Fusarium solani]|uniref:uncharacterized protein n=1 Tax=Fusarium solani TaxID=169388 RepID=UPI0032C44AB4|nr:hypothetical protein MRS44_003837 [Fusarium solani]KAJ3469829.1 hypothetical protein MRS44_003894 [Fusarium solani]
MSSDWQIVAESFQNRRAERLPTRWTIPEPIPENISASNSQVADLLPQWLSVEEIKLTSLGASALASKILAREYTSVQVTEAFCHRASLAQQLTNCLSEVFFDEALERAQQLDNILQSTGNPVGPLHGVPISVKDHFNIKGQFTTAGYISYGQDPPKDEDAHVVDILRNAGAVLYTKTANPQCMMVLETVSNIHGRTLNPWNTHLGPGGSSGGEGALLALQGSPLGLGSDIGGSIRVPAAFNGVYGFKPSAKRIPISGVECTMAGSESIMPSVGPLGRNVEDLELFFRVVLGTEPWTREPLLKLPWKSIPFDPDKKLSVGVMSNDGVVTPHPYMTHAIKGIAQKLISAGHEVINFTPYKHKESWDDILLPLYFPDGGLDIKNTLEAGKEPMLPSAKRLIDDPIIKNLSHHELWKLQIARDEYRKKYLQKWAETGSQTQNREPIDVLICPVAPAAGTPHDVKPWWGYCSQWNLLDYPAGVIPVGKVLPGDAYPANYQAANDLDQENMDLYDRCDYGGMPIAIQVVGPTHEDENVMNAMKILDQLINHQNI